MEKDTRKAFENPPCDVEKDLKNDCADTPYEDYKDVDLEFMKSTRSNFLTWKDHDY